MKYVLNQTYQHSSNENLTGSKANLSDLVTIYDEIVYFVHRSGLAALLLSKKSAKTRDQSIPPTVFYWLIAISTITLVP